MSITVIDGMTGEVKENGFEMPSKDNIADKRKELSNLLKLVKGNPDRLHGLLQIGAICASAFDDEVKPSPREAMKDCMRKLVFMMLRGQVCDGADNQWSCGFLGSRWCDFKLGEYECRAAFYSRKFSTEWDHEKPYCIEITVTNTA